MRNLIACVLFIAACAKTNPEAAKSAMAEYVTHFPDVTSWECADVDSDGDGYCSCTAFRKDGAEPYQIQCGCERLCIWNCARGCKYVPNVKISGRGVVGGQQ